MGSGLPEMNLPRFPLLSDQEMRFLIQKTKKGDKEAREKLINCNLKLVFNLVKRFQNRGYELEDLFQVGCIGLIKAIDKFDLNFDVKFSTYAVPMIIGEIRRFLRDDSLLKVSRSLKENAYKIQKEREHLLARMGREPSIGEIALELGISREEVVTALEAIQAPASLYEILREDENEPIFLIDQLPKEKEERLSLIEKIHLKELLAKLPERDRRILTWRFFEDKTQAEIAARLELSQVQISRLERQALNKIKGLMVQQSS